MAAFVGGSWKLNGNMTYARFVNEVIITKASEVFRVISMVGEARFLVENDRFANVLYRCLL